MSAFADKQHVNNFSDLYGHYLSHHCVTLFLEKIIQSCAGRQV